MRTPDDIHDELLVIRCQEGDSKAFAELVDRWQPRLARHAARMTGSTDGVEEVVQATWVAIVRGIKRLNDAARFRRWAYEIATHKCADWIRAQQRQRATSASLIAEPAEQESPEKEPADEIALLRKALKSMKWDHRIVLAMFYLEEMSLQEVAQSLSLPVGTIKSRLHYARIELKKSIQRRKS